MSTSSLTHGDFTLPGEAGYEKLTLDLAARWGADTIRDSDGTQLSPDILASGHAIYSTLCLVRSIQPWAREHTDKLQQNFLMTPPVIATKATVTIGLLDGYFDQQFRVNFKDSPKQWWQVFDRTTGREVPKRLWSVNERKGTVTISAVEPGHRYTVNFLALRIWEEISMYNHLTNNWGDREHLAAVDPMHPATQRALLEYLDQWLAEHPATTVVRFTSMFYNFSWFWGSDQQRLRDRYSDWGDYAMTVSPRALRLFKQRHGYALTSEDFVQGGRYNSTHNPPTARYRAYIDFLHDFVITFGRQCIERVQAAGKKAFVFYDDHWIGVEPNSPRFPEFGFDGLIKCVFNAFEVRLCGHAKGTCTRELRLHPYLFPTGLKGEPTFQPGGGGNPTLDAKNFWLDARRGILRTPIDRIGLGGYLSLVEPWPNFQDYIALVANEFRQLKALHTGGKPWTAPFKVGILTAWGDLRAWSCSGHFTPGVELYDVLESLAGLPVEVEFLSIDEVAENGVPRGIKTIINCGKAGTAWSGGTAWADPRAEAKLAQWVQRGGGLIGIGEPSALPQVGSTFRLAGLLGVDQDTGDRLANGKYKFTTPGAPVGSHFITADVTASLVLGARVHGTHVLDGETTVLAAAGSEPVLTVRSSGKGRTVYARGFAFTPENTRWLHRALYWTSGHEATWSQWMPSNVRTECAWFAKAKQLVVINNDGAPQVTTVTLGDGQTTREVTLEAHGIAVIGL